MTADVVSSVSVGLEGLKLDDSPFEVSWLIETLNQTNPDFQLISKEHAIRHVKAVNISGGKGFVSKVYKCSIEFESSQPDYDVILKVPGGEALNSAYEDTDRVRAFEDNQQIAAFHNNECDFYNDFAAKINFPSPKMFSTRKWIKDAQVGYLLMEDMSGKGENACIYAGLSKAQLFKIAEHVAHFQYFFLSSPDQSWQQRFAFEKLLDGKQIANLMLPLYDKLIRMKPALFEEKIKPLYEACRNTKFHKYTLSHHSPDCGVPYVLSHGDLWTNNIMWKVDERGNITSEIAAVIDYQLMHTGNLPKHNNDLARVLLCCTDADVRREHETEVLKRYYDTLAALYQKDGSAVPFTFEQVKETYRMSLVCQASKALWLVPLFCCGEKETGSEMLWEARTEKLLLRASLALDDALKVLETIPRERIED